MTLIEFLLARIAEDEAVAHDAMCDGNGKWASWNRSWDDMGWRDLAADGERLTALPTSIDEHVCRHDPARVLAECEVKRRIVERHRPTGGIGCECSEVWPCANLLDLALIYADHPDYLPEWAI